MYTIWTDYGSYEGWSPTNYETFEDLQKALHEKMIGSSYNPIRITKEVDIKVLEVV